MLDNIKVRGIIICMVILVIAAPLLVEGAGGTEEDKKFEIGGGLLGVFNIISHDNQPPTAPKKNQIDLAGNIDLRWNISSKVRVNIQFQGGPGEGNLGFAGSPPAMTDLNVELDLSEKFMLTIGSFDTPFGISTFSLSNNGDASPALFILNSLFYSGLAGTNVGTLNTVGIKAEWDSDIVHLSAAVTNGTNETAFNPEGNFEFVVLAETKPFFGGLYLGASYIKSKEYSDSGNSGSETDFSGWMVDVGYNYKKTLSVSGYYGMITYGDEYSWTDDDVLIWKAQVKLNFSNEKWFLAGRVSGWEPEAEDGDVEMVPFQIPRPGLYNDTDIMFPFPHRKINRFQAGFGYNFSENLVLRGEWIYDRYSASVLQGDMNTTGFLAALNVLF
ncbi:MAG: hypothetical protein GY950_32715 [bacterium]|nr:hypothetical protein [bacterium]